MQLILSVFLGAGVGGVLRHGINQLAMRCCGVNFPYGTFGVNILGSFAMGLVVSYFSLRAESPEHWRLFLTTGILGGFTTFSAFSLEVSLWIIRGEYLMATAYSLFSIVFSVIALFTGMWLMK